MSAEKTKAQRLAEWIESDMTCEGDAEVAAELRRLAAVEAQRDALRQIVEDFPPIEAELQEVSDRAHRLETQRDLLLEALRAMLEQFNYNTITGIVHDESAAIDKTRAAIKAVEGEKT